ncbi:hypothetical protein H4Q26_012924 [Puccinia striiformis f. sp. tritici PST-130]|nr:hypothetical protein H4Q26_012924 [Puccinia striiformis f. sp. tritici PST-130]
MMPYETMQNPSAMISPVPVLDGSSVIFPSWRSRLEDMLAVQEDIKPASKLSKTICDAYEKNTLLAGFASKTTFGRPGMTQTYQLQICDHLLRGLNDFWKTIHDHLVYSPNKVSLDDAIGALEAHKIPTTTLLDHVNADSFNSASAAKTAAGTLERKVTILPTVPTRQLRRNQPHLKPVLAPLLQPNLAITLNTKGMKIVSMKLMSNGANGLNRQPLLVASTTPVQADGQFRCIKRVEEQTRE